jgi:AcrR family transcriptional regulator
MERRLLDATERLMRDGASFTELSVDRLSTEAGISRASFYIYFEDKGHLLRRLAGQVFADLAGGAERWWNVARRHNPDDLRAAMAGIIGTYRRHQPVLLALNEMAAYDPETARIANC